MTGFKPVFSDIRSDCSAICATFTATKLAQKKSPTCVSIRSLALDIKVLPSLRSSPESCTLLKLEQRSLLTPKICGSNPNNLNVNTKWIVLNKLKKRPRLVHLQNFGHSNSCIFLRLIMSKLYL